MNNNNFSVVESCGSQLDTKKQGSSENELPVQLAVVEGDFDEQEKLLYRLRTEPNTFEQSEFENLLDHVFKSRLNFDENLEIIERRIRMSHYQSTLEQRALLAILDGNDDESEHLTGVLSRRNALGLKVISKP